MKLIVSVSEEEMERIEQEATVIGLTKNQYAKKKVLSVNPDISELKKELAKTLCQCYYMAERMESSTDRKIMKEAADQLWQYLK